MLILSLTMLVIIISVLLHSIKTWSVFGAKLLSRGIMDTLIVAAWLVTAFVPGLGQIPLH